MPVSVFRLPVGVAGIKNLLEKLQHQKNHKHADKFWDPTINNAKTLIGISGTEI